MFFEKQYLRGKSIIDSILIFIGAKKQHIRQIPDADRNDVTSKQNKSKSLFSLATKTYAMIASNRVKKVSTKSHGIFVDFSNI